MIYTHSLEAVNLDFDVCIAGHAGDETAAYKEVDGAPIFLSVYHPLGEKQGLLYPAFFFIHGGGWAGHKIFSGEPGWQGDHLGYLARYYANQGFVSISIDYRLLEEKGQKEGYQLVNLYDDCVDAVDYILDRASVYGIDSNCVYLLGESAGGHLAGLVAAKYRREGFQFKRAFLVNAITDLYGDENWNRRVPEQSQHPELKRLSQNESARHLSPLYCIHQEVCPMVLIHGAMDHVVKPVHSLCFYERMQELGGECDLHWIADTNHAFLLAEYTSNLAACKIGIQIIDQYLGEDK